MKTRRAFLSGAAAFPTVVNGSALGLNGATLASDRVTIATIGVGWMGGGHVDEFLKIPQAQYVAVCDLDDKHLTEARAKIDLKYGNQGCATYHAFEEVLARRDIDAVTIATPDHWHGIVAFSAARAGKDIYCEKPLAHNFNEGRAMVEESERKQRVWQTGSWQRSKDNFRQACELVRNGVLGKVHTVEVGLPGGHTDFAKAKDLTEISEPPSTLLYDRWLGPAPVAPYSVARVHKSWRWNYDYGGGQLMDWVGHHVDIAHWGMGFDNTGPLEVTARGEMPPREALWNTATRYRVDCLYPGGVKMVMAGGEKEIRGGTKWIGPNGWIWVTRGKIEASNPEWLAETFPAGPVKLKRSASHYEEFIQAVKTRGETLTPARVALRSATPGWLGNIAMFTGRKIQWDPEKMRIVNDAAAEKLLGREMRAPWRLG